VKALFELPRARVDELRAEADLKGKINPVFEVTIIDAQGEPVARVRKVLSVAPEGRLARGGLIPLFSRS